jgi:hypothetical protein
MTILSFGYRFLSNFVFLAIAYFSLNSMERYQQRAVIAALLLVFAVMRAGTVLYAFRFHQRLERLEAETQRLAATSALSRPNRRIIQDVADIRRETDAKAYIDLLFMVLIVLLCGAKLVTE